LGDELHETLGFLNTQIKSLQAYLQTLQPQTKDFTLEKLLRNFQTMRVLTISVLPLSGDHQLIENRSQDSECSLLEKEIPVIEETVSSPQSPVEAKESPSLSVIPTPPIAVSPPPPPKTQFRTLEECLDLPPAEFLDGLILLNDHFIWRGFSPF